MGRITLKSQINHQNCQPHCSGKVYKGVISKDIQLPNKDQQEQNGKTCNIFSWQCFVNTHTHNY